MSKVTKLDKDESPWANDPSHQGYEYTCPNTGDIKTEPRHLVRTRLAQYTHWINDEINRLHLVLRKCNGICNEIDLQKETEEHEAKKNG